MAQKKTGFVFSGAAALIAQEGAITQALIEGRTLSTSPVKPDVVAGTSSGSLNSIATNAVLDPKVEFYWDEEDKPERGYKQILSNIRNHDVYKFGILPLIEGAILDTRPLRKTLEHIVNDTMGYETMGDLYLPTYLATVERDTGKPVRIYSKNPDHADLLVVDVLMCSTAIPVAFPPQKIHYKDGKEFNSKFFDGGTGPDGIPVEAMVDENCSEIYVISKMRPKPELDRELGLQIPKDLVLTDVHKHQIQLIQNAMLAFDYLMNAIFCSEIRRAMVLSDSAYLYEPQLDKNYSMLDFNCEKEQWDSSWAWAVKNDPLPITDESYQGKICPGEPAPLA